MPELLSAEEARVLGCLFEKEVTTPEYYPLTLNALRNACNQSSSRHPVVSYDDGDVSTALASLREKGLVRIVYSQSNRAAKYRQVADEAMGLDAEERAVICLLLLRGPQTVGELRTRSDRLASFDSLEAVEGVLARLADRDDPLVARLERAPGQKEARHRQLLSPESIPGGPGPSGERTEEVEAEPAVVRPSTEPGFGPAGTEEELPVLRAELSELRSQLADLRSELDELRRRMAPE